MEKHKDDDRILVRALPLFYERRLETIHGLTKGQFRGLRTGEAVMIRKGAFDKNLFVKVKE